MTIFNLPVSDDANQLQNITLEGVNYQYTLKWNTRDEAWYFSITSQGNLFEFSSKLTVGFDILDPWRYKEVTPNGRLAIIDNERLIGRVGRDNFGQSKRFSLWYETSDVADEDSFIHEFYQQT